MYLGTRLQLARIDSEKRAQLGIGRKPFVVQPRVGAFDGTLLINHQLLPSACLRGRLRGLGDHCLIDGRRCSRSARSDWKRPMARIFHYAGRCVRHDLPSSRDRHRFRRLHGGERQDRGDPSCAIFNSLAGRQLGRCPKLMGDAFRIHLPDVAFYRVCPIVHILLC